MKSPGPARVVKFHAFERPDGALVLVPDLFLLPRALQTDQMLRPVGLVDIDLDALSSDLVERIGRNFYGVAHDDDAQRVREALARREPGLLTP